MNIAVYENCNRSVVHIATRSAAMESFHQLSVREGSGSGSVLDNRGMILTNHHVVDGAKEISVSLFNGLAYPAVLVGQDPDTDIAVLKIDAPADQLIPLPWGDAQQLRVGQKIYAIGNPFGLERTMSTGMISSLNRQIPSRAKRTMRSNSNRCGSQPGQFGRAVVKHSRPINRDEYGHHEQQWRQLGSRLRHSSQYGSRRIVPQLIENGHIIRPTIGVTRLRERCGAIDR
ncbi:MAG: S1C family serine protease [Pirellulaceae bacterium]